MLTVEEEPTLVNIVTSQINDACQYATKVGAFAHESAIKTKDNAVNAVSYTTDSALNVVSSTKHSVFSLATSAKDTAFDMANSTKEKAFSTVSYAASLGMWAIGVTKSGALQVLQVANDTKDAGISRVNQTVSYSYDFAGTIIDSAATTSKQCINYGIDSAASAVEATKTRSVQAIVFVADTTKMVAMKAVDTARPYVPETLTANGHKAMCFIHQLAFTPMTIAKAYLPYRIYIPLKMSIDTVSYAISSAISCLFKTQTNIVSHAVATRTQVVNQMVVIKNILVTQIYIARDLFIERITIVSDISNKRVAMIVSVSKDVAISSINMGKQNVVYAWNMANGFLPRFKPFSRAL